MGCVGVKDAEVAEGGKSVNNNGAPVKKDASLPPSIFKLASEVEVKNPLIFDHVVYEVTEVKLVGDGTQIQITGHSFANENENKTITLQKQDKVEMAQTEIELRRALVKKGDYSNVIVEGHAPGHTWSWPLPARLQKMYQNLDGTYGGNAIYVQLEKYPAFVNGNQEVNRRVIGFEIIDG